MPLATHDILMSKARKITKHQTHWTPWIKSGLKWPKNDKKNMTKIVFPRCLELISGRLEDPVNFGKFGLKKGTGVDPPTCE